MRDTQIIELAAAQFNRVSRRQLNALEYSDHAIDHRLEIGRLVATESGVFAVAPVLDDPWGRWKGATLTDDETYLSGLSASVAFEFLGLEGPLITVTRPGWGGPRRHGGILVYRRNNLAGEVGELRGVSITSPERTLLDVASQVSERALARAVREAIRLQASTLEDVIEFTAARSRRRGARRLIRIASRYAGIPLERARSGAEVRAMIVFRDASYQLPKLNEKIAGVEADLSWKRLRLIIEVDGGPFHQDVGEDARKEAIWTGAGYEVRRIPSDDVYDHPQRLLALVPEASVSLSPGDRRAKGTRT